MLEDDALNLRVGEHLARLAERVPGGIVFKASFDKANRSNAGALRGPGLDEGLAALERVRAATGLPSSPTCTCPSSARRRREVVDVLQIPAFLCRQTDLLVAAGATGKPVNVKKGQWMHPEGMRGAVDKVRAGLRRAPARRRDRGRRRPSAAPSSATATSSSTCARFARMRAACDAPVDLRRARTACSSPGAGEGGASGGAREFIPPLDARRRARPARTACSSRRIPIPTTRRATGRTCCRSTQLDDAGAARRRRLASRARDDRSARSRASHPPRRPRRRRRADRRRHLPRRRRRRSRVELKRYDIQDGLGIHFLQRGRDRASRSSPAACPRACGCAPRELGVDDVAQDPRRAQAARASRACSTATASRRRRRRSSATTFPTSPCCGSSGSPSPSAMRCRRSARVCALQLTRDGGRGAVREFAELLLKARGEWDDA